MKPSKILVTGGAGYIGSICVEEMLNRGFEMVVFEPRSQDIGKIIDSASKWLSAHRSGYGD